MKLLPAILAITSKIFHKKKFTMWYKQKKTPRGIRKNVQ